MPHSDRLDDRLARFDFGVCHAWLSESYWSPGISRREVELGFDASALDGRIGVAYTYYNQHTYDALVPVQQAPSLGFAGSQLVNVGQLLNHGHELQLSGELIRRRAVDLTAKLNFTSVKSEAGDIGGNPIVFADQVLGFRDGVIDRRDQYQKVQGRLVFRVTDAEWTAGQGNYRPRLNGAVAAGKYIAPVNFGATEAHMPDLTSQSFTNSQSALRGLANGAAFDQQVATNLGEAARDFGASAFITELLGEDDAAHYRIMGEHEWSVAQAAVTDWQLRRYFDRI